jgi:hypothetical protein
MPSRRASSVRLHHPGRRRWKLRQLTCRPDWAFDEFAATVWALPAGQTVAHAIRAKRTFERADPRVGRIRRKILVAAFTIRAQRKHVWLLFSSDWRTTSRSASIDLATDRGPAAPCRLVSRQPKASGIGLKRDQSPACMASTSGTCCSALEHFPPKWTPV